MVTETQTQFTIYRIDVERVMQEYEISKGRVNPQEIVKKLIDSVVNSLRGKKCKGLSCIVYREFEGVLFKTEHIPDWKDTLNYLLKNNELVGENKVAESFITNTNVSFVLFQICEENVYCMMGGYGSYYIKKYIERNFGLYLLPKIIKKDNPVVKNVVENNLTGNRASTRRTNRSNTSFLSEQDLSSIYKQLNVEIDKDIGQHIGISFNEEEQMDKKINMVNKDSLVIRRSMSLQNLTTILKRIKESMS